MTHPRKSIRQALVDLLKAPPQTAAGDRVFGNRVIPVKHQEVFPVIAIYTLREEKEEFSSAPRVLNRQLDVGITIIESATDQDPVDDLVDLVVEQIEAKLNVDRTLGGLCQDVSYEGFDAAFDHQGRELTGGGRLRYRIQYQTEEPEGALVLEPFVEVNVKVNLAPPDGAFESEDTVLLEQ